MKVSLKTTLSAVVLCAAGAALAGERMVIEAILIRVNDRIMTVGDFRQRLQVELSQIPAPPVGEALRTFSQALFESVLDEMVLLERAQEKRILVDEEMVDQAIDSLREENNLQEDAAFAQALESAGLSEEKLRERYRRSMLIQRTAQSEVKPSEITEEQLRQRYEAELDSYRIPAKVELEQLFFPIAADGSDRDQVMRLARGLVDRVRQGSDLKAEATLAGIQLQELGAIPEADLRQDLRQVLEELEEGGLTNPLDTGGGIQVIRLVRRIEAGVQLFDEVKELIRRQVSLESYEQQTRGVVERLKEEYLVKVDQEGLAEIIDQLIMALGEA
jgi:parvulin-like peptidyl-prolyl isomerase